MFYIKKKNSLQELKKEEKKMKIKKGLALILALVMIITLMPTMAFAKTSIDTVADRITVKADSPMSKISTYLTAKNDWDDVESVRISLSLENAEWTTNPAVTASTAPIEAVDGVVSIPGGPTIKIDAKDEENDNKAEVASVDVTSVGDNSIIFNINLKTGTNILEDDQINLTFEQGYLTSGSEEGAINLVIENDSSSVISPATIKIADVVSGKTTASVTGTVKTYPRGYAEGAAIKITEVTADAWSTDKQEVIELTLPKNVTWNIDNSKGTLADVTGSAVSNFEFANEPLKKLPQNNDEWQKLNSGSYILTNGGRKLTFVFKAGEDAQDFEIDSLIITPYINIGRDAAEGDITVDLVGQNNVSDASGLVIAKYGNESVEVSTVEEVPTIVSGYVTDTKDKKFTVSVTLKESMKGSLAGDRYVDFDLPEEVQITGPIKAKVNKGSQVTATRVTVDGMNKNDADPAKDTSGFEFQVPDLGTDMTNWDTAKANTVTFEIPVTVEAGFTGDITMNVTGSKAGVADTELVVATAEAPITVETATTNVKNGVQTQTVADITITENFPGYMEDSDKLYLGIDTLGLTAGSAAFESFDSIEVTDGNLEIGRCKIDGDRIMIPIDGESTRVSTIELKGLTLVLNRTLPEGGYDLQATGDAVVKNANDDGVKGYNDGDFSDVAVTTEDYLVITTPADDAAGINATFTDGQASYTLNGQTVTMDVAPYIDSNNRMLVPIRYAANAMGVSDDNIQWNSYTQTGTISGAMGVVRVTVGSTNLITSNGTITMDTVAVNTNNRIYVPVRYIANALGASVSWDPATRTATFS